MAGLVPAAACANPTVVVDARSGAVLEATEATRPWYPASLSKLMTLYTAFKLMADRRIDGGTPILISRAAARQAPSKMGYAPGTLVTLDDAIKMLVVHSANDIAWAIAENLGGSVEGFSAEMNRYSRGLGMRESHWANPNGLPDPRQITSARDMAILARAIVVEYPHQAELFRIQTIQSGQQIMRTHNPLLYRYAGSDGMKTGFTCSAGFNIVASVTRDNRRLITVIMGSPTAKARTQQAVQLFESGFSIGAGGGLFSGRPQLASLAASSASTPFDMKPIACNPRKGGSAKAQNEDMAETESPPPATGVQGGAQAPTLASAAGPNGQPVPIDPEQAGLLATHWVLDPPIVVGPYSGPLKPLLAADPGLPVGAMKTDAKAEAPSSVTSFADPAPAGALGAIRPGVAGSAGALPGQIPRQGSAQAAANPLAGVSSGQLPTAAETKTTDVRKAEAKKPVKTMVKVKARPKKASTRRIVKKPAKTAGAAATSTPVAATAPPTPALQ